MSLALRRREERPDVRRSRPDGRAVSEIPFRQLAREIDVAWRAWVIRKEQQRCSLPRLDRFA